jgi:hypothetical protein
MKAYRFCQRFQHNAGIHTLGQAEADDFPAVQILDFYRLSLPFF